jgi:hypothetical protein
MLDKACWDGVEKLGWRMARNFQNVLSLMRLRAREFSATAHT